MLHILFLLSIAFAWNYDDQTSWKGNCEIEPERQSPIDIDTDVDDEISKDRKLHMVMLG